MASINTVLKMQDKMSSQLEAVGKQLSKIETDMGKVGKASDDMQNKLNKAGNSISNVFKGVLGADIVKKGLSMITSEIGNAVSRFDTINNFSKIMGNMNISAEESEAALDKLKEKLKGIPTTLDSAALSVERFTSKNGNIQASTEMFLALNDAILAGAAPMDMQRTALEQISQAYSKNKPDMMEWRTIMSTMPAQLTQIALSLGYVAEDGRGNMDALGEALRSGETSMNEFMATIIRLDHEGAEGFKSLYEQARASTGGIQTGMANMKAAIDRGLESLIRGLDEAFANQGGIAGVMGNIGSQIEQALVNLIPVIVTIANIVTPMLTFVANNISWLLPTILGLVGAVKALQIASTLLKAVEVARVGIMAALTGQTFAQTAAQMGQVGVNATATATQWGLNTALYACPLVWIIALIALLVAAIAGLIGWITDLWDTNDEFANAVITVCDRIEIAFDAVGAVIEFIKNSFKTFFLLVATAAVNFAVAFLKVWDGIATGVENVVGGILGVIQNMINGIIDMINGLADGLRSIPIIGNLIGDGRIGHVTFADDYKAHAASNQVGRQATIAAVQGLADNIWDETKATHQSNVNQFNKRLGEMATKTIKQDATRADRVKNRKKFNEDKKDEKSAVQDAADYQKAMEDLMRQQNNTMKDVTTGNGGGKAVKTTTDDDLLSDDDIKLLMDVATRDYKLNYQAITPNITVTFGDVRETADIDQVVSQITDRLEEVCEANLGVT